MLIVNAGQQFVHWLSKLLAEIYNKHSLKIYFQVHKKLAWIFSLFSLNSLFFFFNLCGFYCFWCEVISSIQSLSHVLLFATPRTAAHQASLSITNSWSLLKLKFIESVTPSNHLILCISLLLPSIFLKIRVFSNESVLCIRWPKYWSFSFNISPSNEYSGLISFRIDWLDLLAVQRILKSLLQHHNSKASILQCLALWSNFHIHTQLLEKP